MMDKAEKGITLIELLVAIAIVGIISVLVAPEIGRFRSNYNARSCATDLIQYMRVARAMAIKENREYLIVFHMAGNPGAAINPQGRYLIGFDGDGDNDLTTVNSDTFGICKDTLIFDSDGDGILDRGDRLPDTDADANGDGVPDCVRVVNLNDCGNDISFNTQAPNGPDDDGDGNPDPLCVNGLGVCFGAMANPVRANFNSDGSVDDTGYTYFQQATRGYSYVVTIRNTAGATNMWKWDGDADNLGVATWTEIR